MQNFFLSIESKKELYEQGFTVVKTPMLLKEQLEARLKVAMIARKDLWKNAGMGRNSSHQNNQTLRGDFHFWLNPDELTLDGEEEVCQMFNDICSELNHSFPVLQLKEWEAQLACYGEGKGYIKHLDSFADGKNRRKISIVTYLNSEWNESDGGRLILYPKGQEPIFVIPTTGTIVIFDSEDIEHEVEITKRERWSISGWLKT